MYCSQQDRKHTHVSSTSGWPEHPRWRYNFAESTASINHFISVTIPSKLYATRILFLNKHSWKLRITLYLQLLSLCLSFTVALLQLLSVCVSFTIVFNLCVFYSFYFTVNSFPLTWWVKAACFVLAIKVLLHARVLTLICACPIFKANFSHYKFSNANLRNFYGFLAKWAWS